MKEKLRDGKEVICQLSRNIDSWESEADIIWDWHVPDHLLHNVISIGRNKASIDMNCTTSYNMNSTRLFITCTTADTIITGQLYMTTAPRNDEVSTFFLYLAGQSVRSFTFTINRI